MPACDLTLEFVSFLDCLLKALKYPNDLQTNLNAIRSLYPFSLSFAPFLFSPPCSLFFLSLRPRLSPVLLDFYDGSPLSIFVVACCEGSLVEGGKLVGAISKEAVMISLLLVLSRFLPSIKIARPSSW